MNKLFTFGDSFTYIKPTEYDGYALLYKQPEDYYWPEILAKKFNLELVNFGFGSFSNDRIIDSILENHHLIKENDVVIIGKSFYHRFDIPNYENEIDLSVTKKFTTITPFAYKLLIELGYTEEEGNSIIYFLNLIDDPVFIDRTNLRYNFIKDFLFSKKIKKCIFWEVTDCWENFENITTATNGIIDDNHWSYKGHLDFTNYLLNQYDEK